MGATQASPNVLATFTILPVYECLLGGYGAVASSVRDGFEFCT